MQKNLIVGIDPGTTTGLAVIDLKGRIILTESKKEFKTSEIKEKISGIGNPLFVATDKSSASASVKKLASSFNCNLFEPDHDLKVFEKKELLGSESLLNVHEKDALASAFFAYKQYEAQFNKIEKILGALSLEKYSDKVKEMVVNKKAKNIAEAIEKITKKDVRKIKIKEKTSDTDFLLRNLENQKRKIELQRLYIDKLEKKTKELEREKSQLMEKQTRKANKLKKEVLREKEFRVKDDIIRQIRDELEKERKNKKVYEMKYNREKELEDIEGKERMSVLVLEKFTREEIEKLDREFGIENNIVWIKEQGNIGKSLLRFFADLKPRAVIGLDLKEENIVILDLTPKMHKWHASVSREEFEKALKDSEKKGFLRWLKGYRKRSI